MNRLQSELQRLYLPRSTAGPGSDGATSSLIDPRGMVRAMVLELARPADWELLSQLWRGVQADLELPAPAIAVSGTDGLQLWFSLAEPVPVAQAHAFLASACVRYLPGVAPARLRLLPTADTASPQQATHARLVPALQLPSGHWSAFVAPDLAAIFADTPWLDSAPGDDAQAGVLRPLASIDRPAFAAALERLGVATPQAPSSAPEALPIAVEPTQPQPAAPAAGLNPRHFLLQVMNDDSVALGLRIEAAKALLPYSEP